MTIAYYEEANQLTEEQMRLLMRQTAMRNLGTRIGTIIGTEIHRSIFVDRVSSALKVDDDK